MSRRLISAPLCLLVIVASFATKGEACSCRQPPPPLVAAAESDAVFVGQVVSVGLSDPNNSFAHFVVQFEASEIFVGDQGRTTIQVHTSRSGASCGHSFSEGETWVIYGRQTAEGDLWTGLCERTRRLEFAADDLIALRNRPQPLGLDVALVSQAPVFTVVNGGNRRVALEFSSDLIAWETVLTLVAAGSSHKIEGIDFDRPMGFYRLREE